MEKYKGLNPAQQEAVFHTEGPLLILAGAGSGKTRVLTHRIAYIIEQKKAHPWEIMAITFTNKAAKEMRERVDKLIGHGGSDVWVSTFHSSCVKILRRHIDKIGYDRSFTIYDTDDSKKIIKECIKEKDLDPKQFKEGAILGAISSAKNDMKDPALYKQEVAGNYRLEVYGQVYALYEDKLLKNNALDFGDLLKKTVELFQLEPTVLKYYQERFKYIMVDEYQDTNGVQFAFVRLLAKGHQNLCVVGDDDQSIYRFRGADIRHILEFEKVFKSTKVIKLEQNYRSSGNILETANQVIHNNVGRKVKKLWTDKEDGNLVKLIKVANEREEAELIANEIVKGIEDDGFNYYDYALLYRTNAQSRALEEGLVRKNVPYKIVGGTSFYQRKEIKDVLGYLKTINNEVDDLAIKRIINVPKRGIGQTSVDKITKLAERVGINFYDALRRSSEVLSSGAVGKINGFVSLIQKYKGKHHEMSLVQLTEELLEEIGYRKELTVENTTESLGRLENINELISKLTEYEQITEEPTLSGFLEEVALIADIDQYVEDSNYVVLMTMHSAKGLEFPCVFITGMEDGLFPSYMSINSGDEEDIEEERRLCYVGITRAETQLYLTYAAQRMVRGQTQYNPISRYVKEIPSDLIESEELDFGGAPAQIGRPNYLNVKGFVNENPYKQEKKSHTLPVGSNATLDFKVGDLVQHKKFGMGQVKIIEPGGADFQVTVNFPSIGMKKLLASLSGLKKI